MSKPENWDEMGAVARDRWQFQQSKKGNKKNLTSSGTSSDKPENWEEMGAIARDIWAKSKNTLPPKIKKVYQEYEYWQQMVADDYNSLKSVLDHDKRNQFKPSLLSKYRDYLAEAMSANEAHQNDVLFYNIIWALDTQDFDYALILTDYAVKIGQKAIEPFKSLPATFFADSVRKLSEPLFDNKQDLPAIFGAVLARIDDGRWEVNQISKAKFFKLKGLILEKKNDLKNALGYWNTALFLYDRVGVKKLIESAEKRL